MPEIPRLLIYLQEAEISKLKLNQGDKILIKVDTRLSQDQLDLIKTKIASVIPGHKIIIMDQGLTLEILEGKANGKQ